MVGAGGAESSEVERGSMIIDRRSCSIISLLARDPRPNVMVVTTDTDG